MTNSTKNTNFNTTSTSKFFVNCNNYIKNTEKSVFLECESKEIAILYCSITVYRDYKYYSFEKLVEESLIRSRDNDNELFYENSNMSCIDVFDDEIYKVKYKKIDLQVCKDLYKKKLRDFKNYEKRKTILH